MPLPAMPANAAPSGALTQGYIPAVQGEAGRRASQTLNAEAAAERVA